MEKLPMCRICLVQNVRMYVVVNRNLHELYEKLTDIPFVTKDRRPILACFFCCTKLKQCWRLLRKCLEAEKLFAQIMNEDYEPKDLINHNHLEFLGGLIYSPIENISIVDDVQTESIAIKEELPAVATVSLSRESLDDIIEPKEETQSDELELENIDNSCQDIADIPPHHSKSDSEDDVPLMEFKIEVEEEQEVSKKKKSRKEKRREEELKYQRARETNRATVAKKPKQDTRRTKLKYATTAEQSKKEKTDSKVIRTTQKHTSKPDTYFKEPYKCGQRSFNEVKKNTQHIRTQIGGNPKCDVCQRSFRYKRSLIEHIRIHTGEKPYKCDICHHSCNLKANLIKHMRIHTGEKSFKCDICERRFRQINHLKKHLGIHTGEKPYKCDVCQRSFNVKKNLKSHIRIHIGEKPYKCDVCQRSFRHKCSLIMHMCIRSGENPYKCDVCQRSFYVKSNLKNHIRIHIGEKSYKCDVCQRSFRHKSSLIMHMRMHTHR